MVRFKHFLRGGIDHGNWQGDQMGEGDPALFDAPPRLVETQDGEGTLDEVRTWIRKGALTPDDLVDFGRGWENVKDAPELEEAVEAAPRPKRRRPWWLIAALVSWGAGMATIGPLNLSTASSFFIVLGIPMAWLMVWAMRLDIIRNSPTAGALPTVTENVFEKPSEAEPGSVSIAAREVEGEGGGVSLSRVQDVGAPGAEEVPAPKTRERA